MKENYHPVSTYKVTAEYDGVRLDNCLIAKLKGLPRTKIYSIIRKGEVRVNKSRSQPSTRLRVGDIVRIPPYRTSSKSKGYINNKDLDKISESIISEEKDYLIVNKPVGYASHGGSGITGGVIEIIRELKPNYKNAQLAHRIDKDTSGCLVIALKKTFLRKLHEEIRNKEVDKVYDLIVCGQWPVGISQIKEPIYINRSANGEREATIDSKGKEALTSFTIVKKSSKYSLLKASIYTGRMHQIRIHTKNAGFPILGDVKYGDEEANKLERSNGLNRMMLHAHSINFKNLGLKAMAKTPNSFFSFVD